MGDTRAGQAKGIDVVTYKCLLGVGEGEMCKFFQTHSPESLAPREVLPVQFKSAQGSSVVQKVVLNVDVLEAQSVDNRRESRENREELDHVDFMLSLLLLCFSHNLINFLLVPCCAFLL